MAPQKGAISFLIYYICNMQKVETCLFIVKINGEDTLVKCEGAYVSELNQLYLKLKMPGGGTMNYYIAGLNDENKFKVSLN